MILLLKSLKGVSRGACIDCLLIIVELSPDIFPLKIVYLRGGLNHGFKFFFFLPGALIYVNIQLFLQISKL